MILSGDSREEPLLTYRVALVYHLIKGLLMSCEGPN